MLTEQDLMALSTMIDTKLEAMETRLDEKIRHNGVMLESLQDKVQLVYENQVAIIDHNRRQDDIEIRLDEHDTRLFAVEQVIKAG